MSAVRQESTGWRDEAISLRHRAWGADCPAVDIDLLLVEYHLGRPCALIEYKHHRAPMPSLEHATCRALASLADASQIPFLLAFYWPSTWSFRVRTVNAASEAHFTDGELLTERQFVSRLYRLRRLAVADELSGKLNDRIPDEVLA